jgi:hypothetical protein
MCPSFKRACADLTDRGLSLCNDSPDRPAGLACAGTSVSNLQEARQKASDDLSRAVAVFPFAVKKLMARLNDQGVGASLVCWEACLPQAHFFLVQ